MESGHSSFLHMKTSSYILPRPGTTGDDRLMKMLTDKQRVKQTKTQSQSELPLLAVETMVKYQIRKIHIDPKLIAYWRVINLFHTHTIESTIIMVYNFI